MKHTFSLKHPAFPAGFLGTCLMVLASILLPASAQTQATWRPFMVRVMVFTMFDPETAPWLKNETLPLNFHVPGAYSDMHCNSDGLCVTTTDEGKANIAASSMAPLQNPHFTFAHSYFLTAGIAGVSPKTGTLGFAGLARWIVDWDEGTHDVPGYPFKYYPNTALDSAVYHLNENLVQLAFQIVAHVKLQDSAEAIAARQKYPGQAKQHPYVKECDTVAGDDYWTGRFQSAEAQYITSLRTGGKGVYCTTEEEDTALATVLNRFGFLDRYINVRTGSDFDQPSKGESVRQVLNTFPGATIAFANEYLVGSTIAHYLIKHDLL